MDESNLYTQIEMKDMSGKRFKKEIDILSIRIKDFKHNKGFCFGSFHHNKPSLGMSSLEIK